MATVDVIPADLETEGPEAPEPPSTNEVPEEVEALAEADGALTNEVTPEAPHAELAANPPAPKRRATAKAPAVRRSTAPKPRPTSAAPKRRAVEPPAPAPTQQHVPFSGEHADLIPLINEQLHRYMLHQEEVERRRRLEVINSFRIT